MQKFFLALFFFFSLSAHAESIQIGAVATSHPKATLAAFDVLKAGGNAVDAAIAASFVINVVQPYKMGIGGGGLLVAHTKGGDFLFDHREQAPASAHEKMLLNEKGEPLPRKIAITGTNPVGIPGTPAGLYAAHKKLGKMPWKKLMAYAIRYAEEGFPISQRFEDELEDNWKRMSSFPSSVSIFSNAEGNHLLRGQMLRQPALASTLKKLSEKGGNDFYTGELAKSWSAEAQKIGVKIDLNDLKNYRVREQKPVIYEVFGLKALTAAPPSTGGILVAGALRFLDYFYKTHAIPKSDSVKRIVATAETMNFYQKLRDDNLADPPYGKIDPKIYLGSEEEKANWKMLTEKIEGLWAKTETAVGALPSKKADLAAFDREGVSHTTHLSVIDKNGMSVAYTTTIEALFGSGITVPNHGFLLNNELADFDSIPGRPNSPAPGKRPRSNMSPTILVDAKNQTRAIIGCAGGLRIPTTIIEVLENYYIQKQTGEEAMAHARFQYKKENLIEVEKSIPQKTVDALRNLGYQVEVMPTFWSVAETIVRRDANAKWEIVTDPRYEGLGLSL